MNQNKTTEKAELNLREIINYIKLTSGLNYSETAAPTSLNIFQSSDSKSFVLDLNIVEEVIHRVDFDGKSFRQINFSSGNKILLTDMLVGFKPAIISGLDLNRLPKVVTTPDIYSVLEAIEDVLSSDRSQEVEIEILRKVFQSILTGATRIGFDMENEKKILESLPFPRARMAA